MNYKSFSQGMHYGTICDLGAQNATPKNWLMRVKGLNHAIETHHHGYTV